LSALCIITVCIGSLHGQTDIPGGSVTGTWTKDNSPYKIYGDISVPANQTLIIEPGVKVIFQGHYHLSIMNADLIAVGTPSDTILFTVADTNGLANGGEDEGAWEGISFSFGSESGDTNRLSFCRFEYIKDPYRFFHGFSKPKLVITNCVFEHIYCTKGFWFESTDADLKNNVFRNNSGSSTLLDLADSDVRLTGNRVENNSFNRLVRTAIYGFPVIERNVFKNNDATYIIYSTEELNKPLICNNMIINNRVLAYPVYIVDCDARIYGNLIANNDKGGLYIKGGDPKVINNTIVNNSNLYCLRIETDNGEFNGNILYGNTLSVYYRKGSSEPSFRNNLIEGGIAGFIGDPYTGPSSGNLDTIPEFINETTGTGSLFDAEMADFGLLPTSPAINIGDPLLNEENFLSRDVYGNDRIKYGIIDAGVAEAHIPSITVGPETISSDQSLTADTVWVAGNIIVDDDVVLTIAGGSRVIFEGPYYIDVNGTLLADGTETDSIWFTVGDTTGFAGDNFDAGCWKGIKLVDQAGAMDDNVPSSFKYCIFEFGKTDNTASYDGGVFMVKFIEDLTVSNSVFRNNRGKTGMAVLAAYTSNIVIDQCNFVSNYSINSSAATGVLFLSSSDVSVSHSAFKNNIAANGVCIYQGYGELQSSHNTFHNNHDFDNNGYGSVLEGQGSVITIMNDLAANNSQFNDGAYYFRMCDVTITNSTIVNNRSDWMNFTGGIKLSRSELTITNSILFGNYAGDNKSSIFMDDENSDPDLYNCLIENGTEGITTFSGFNFTGDYVNCLSLDPMFINSTSLPGADEPAGEADWQLLDISPAINAGVPDTSGLNLTSFDLGGGPRILNGRIDIGAYEKMGNPPLITKNPVGGSFCTGDTILLSVEYTNTDTVNITWIKDGVAIPGAIDKTYKIYSASLTDEGNYSCILSNTFETVNSMPVLLSVKAPPKVLVEQEISWVEPETTVNLGVQVEGSAPLQYTWRKNGADIPEAILPEYSFIPDDPSYEGIYDCFISNSCGADSTTPVNIYLAPQICMVTFSTATGNNLVVWEKQTSAPIDFYNIYRESQTAGIYDLLGTVGKSDLSVFVDTTADPVVQAYLYKITGVDTSGFETDLDLCAPHKTIHLLVSTNPELNTTQLEWDRYYGFDYGTYIIFRSPTGSGYTPIHYMASSLYSWTDPSPLPDVGYYRIGVEKKDPCLPSGGSKKADSGPYSHAMSNTEDNRLQEQGNLEPTAILLDNNTIDENLPVGSFIGRLETSDPDSSDHHIYKLVTGEGDTDNNRFTTLGDLLITAEVLDHEMVDTCYIRVKTTDKGDLSIVQTFIILVNDEDETLFNEAPTGIMFSSNTIAENMPALTMIGRLQTDDPNLDDLHTYLLVEGEGGDDNGSFVLVGDVLFSAITFDFETKNEYHVRIQSTDNGDGNLTTEESFTIMVNDLLEVEVNELNGNPGKLSIYPNPFTHTTLIEFPNPEKAKYRIYITDLAGKVVLFEDDIFADKLELGRENLPAGVYFLELRGPRTFRGKIIIQ